MKLEEQIDPDEILRDVDDDDSDADASEHVRELNFGSIHDHKANFREMAGDLDNA
jgi:hypothetical protein